jgi:septum formation protein
MSKNPVNPKIYLASKSPRRQQLLKQIGIDFILLSADIDETPLPGESALQTAKRLADKKALAGWNSPNRTLEIPVLAADTLGLLDNELLMKPRDKEDAINMLSKMSAREHQIITAVSLCFNNKIDTIESVSSVRFCKLSQQQIEQYWNTGEAADKAGSYAIQGQGARFVESIEGSYSGIVGLPLQQTWKLLQQFNPG